MVRNPRAKCGTLVGTKKWRLREVVKLDNVTQQVTLFLRKGSFNFALAKVAVSRHWFFSPLGLDTALASSSIWDGVLLGWCFCFMD